MNKIYFNTPIIDTIVIVILVGLILLVLYLAYKERIDKKR